jgi:hypothetical protein
MIRDFTMMIRGFAMEWRSFDEYIPPLTDGLRATEDHLERVESCVGAPGAAVPRTVVAVDPRSSRAQACHGHTRS